MKKYDVIVIGGGAAGLIAAGKASETCENVLLVEKNERYAIIPCGNEMYIPMGCLGVSEYYEEYCGKKAHTGALADHCGFDASL